MPSRGCCKNASTRVQTRVCQVNAKCTDCSPSPQDYKTALDSLQTLNRNKNKTAHTCYYCGAQNWTREHSKICKAKNHTCGRCNKKGHLESLCRSAGTPLHMIEAQDYTSLQPVQSQETLQDYNQCLETAQYSTPYFMSKGELPQTTCNSLKTVQVSRLGANEQSEHIQLAWVAQSQNS